MTAEVQRFTGEHKEQLGAHMVDMHFGLPGEGVNYSTLVNIDEALRAFRDEFGEQLGVKGLAAHIAAMDRELRVIAHVDGFRDDADEVVVHISRVVESYGVDVPLGIPEYSVSSSALPRAS